ncbi:MAG TPA: MFS transporter [Candidatus Dormibacteraeota bacterium]|nr:MFS transporter [Candidatus Dormibacteraeota bacterium]
MPGSVVVATPAGVGRRVRGSELALLSLYWIAIGYLWTSLGALILPDLVVHLVGRAHKGVALSGLEAIGTVMAVVWQPMVGSISDRWTGPLGRRRPFIVAGTVGDLIFLTGLALSGSYWVLVIFYFLLQTASNTAQGPYQGLLPDVVPPEQRGQASGYYGAANLLGILGGTVGAGYLLHTYGRVAAVESIAILLAVTMLLTVALVPDTVRPTRQQFSSPWQAFRDTFDIDLKRHRDFAWLMASRLLILMGVVGLQSFAFFYFADVFFPGQRQQTTAATSELLGLVILVALLVTYPAARLSDRIGRRNTVFAGGMVGAAAIAAIVFSHYDLLPAALVQPVAGALQVPYLAAQAVLIGIVSGAGLGAFLSVDWAFITEVIPPAEAGRFMGISNIATAGSGIMARLIAGGLLDHFNAGPRILGLPGGYPVIFSIFATWMILGSLLVLKVREPRR